MSKSIKSGWRRAGVACAVLLTCIAAASAPAAELELRRVMLSAGGVGYFEYEAQVVGDAVLALSVRLDQVDDVLKSVVVFDDQGRAGGIRLAGREPLQSVFRDLPFGPEALASPVALLMALPGSEIQVTGQRRLAGRLVAVVPEQTRTGDGEAVITRHRVSIMTELGMQTFLFEEADAVTFTDDTLRAQIDRALRTVSAHRTRDRRTLEVVSNGTGKRTVRVGYVVAAPLWKASYRLGLDAASAGKARLQGWAVLENMSGQDWRDVDLTLVSGNPVTFRQALYAAYYVDRPEVPVEVLGRVLPAPDAGAIDLDAKTLAEREARFRRHQRAAGRGAADESAAVGALLRAAPAPASAPMPATEAAPEPAPPGQARILAAASTEAATSVSFRIPNPVTVSSGQSLLVPLVDRQVPARRIAVYQPATHPRHPLAAVRLSNDGETGLPPGVLTLYETDSRGASFVGDAQLAPLPAGEQRLVSYALDQKTVIDQEVENTRSIVNARLAKGALELRYSRAQRTVYRIKAPRREPRRVLIEHPRSGGWKLVEPDTDAVSITPTSYRIERDLVADAADEMAVVMSQARSQQIALARMDAPQFLAYAENGDLKPAIRKAFAVMARLRAEVDTLERRIQAKEQERKTLHQEQKRIRDNLARVPRDSDLHRRYLKKLDKQEDAQEAILADADAARRERDAARSELETFIQGLDL